MTARKDLHVLVSNGVQMIHMRLQGDLSISAVQQQMLTSPIGSNWSTLRGSRLKRCSSSLASSFRT
jgi:hypothetical protein